MGNVVQLNRPVNGAGHTMTVDIDVDADLSDAAPCEGYSFGILYIPSTFNGTQVAFHVCPTKGGTFVPLYDGTTGALLTLTAAASTAIALPPELFGAAYFKIETVTDQADTDTVFTVHLKA